MSTVTIHEAKTTLSKLIACVENGEEFIIARGHTPVAKLVPFRQEHAPRPKVGTITSGPITVAPGCFEPLTDAEMEEWGMA